VQATIRPVGRTVERQMEVRFHCGHRFPCISWQPVCTATIGWMHIASSGDVPQPPGFASPNAARFRCRGHRACCLTHVLPKINSCVNSRRHFFTFRCNVRLPVQEALESFQQLPARLPWLRLKPLAQLHCDRHKSTGASPAALSGLFRPRCWPYVLRRQAVRKLARNSFVSAGSRRRYRPPSRPEYHQLRLGRTDLAKQ
jgi:hypothetical protein